MALPEIIKDIEARVKDTGDTMTGLLKAHGGISLNDSTEQSRDPLYLLGIKAFADGGNVIWSSVNDVFVGTANNAYNDINGSRIDTTYLKLAGGTMTGPIKNGTLTNTWVSACNGNAFINSTRGAGTFSPMLSGATSNGRMTLAFYTNALQVAYITKANCDINNNDVAKVAKLFTESGGAEWPGLLTQGSPSTDTSISNMNRFEADLFVSGNGSALNEPKVPGFYLGKSSGDENRHMDIVSGGQYSYIDFNKASIVEDYRARILVDVESGLTQFMWSTAATQPQLQVNGSFYTSGTVGVGGSNTSYRLYVNGISYFNGRMVIKGNGSSYNEGLRILPAPNGWSNIFFSADDTLSETHDGGWLIGRRGAAGGTTGAKGDFTIEEQSSAGVGLTIHKDNGGMTLRNGTFKILGTETNDGSGQLAIFKALSTQASSSGGWIGRSLLGAKDLTFLLGTYSGMAAIGAHSWSDSATGAGAAWAPMYFQPDGGANAAIYMGQNGGGWTKNTGTVEIKGSGTAYTGTVAINGTTTMTSPVANSNNAHTGVLAVNNTISDPGNAYFSSISMFAPNVAAGKNHLFMFGKARSSKDSAYLGFNWSATNSSNNFITLGLYAVDNVLNITGAGRVGIGTTTPSHNLTVVGSFGNESNGITSTIYAQNTGYLHYSTNAGNGHWFNKNVYVQGNVYVGNSYNSLVLHAGNYSSYALPLIKHTTAFDFNTATQTGFHSVCVTGNTNTPSTGNHGLLIVDSDVGTDYQIWSPDNSMALYKRWNSSGTWSAWSNTWAINITGSATYFPCRYDGGDQPNPQQYFGQYIGLRSAMTRYGALTNDTTAWHDTLWINGYAGSDVPNLTAITTIRNGTPRMFLSSQAHTATSYGKYYEVMSAYNIPFVYSSDIDYIPSESRFKLTRGSSGWSSHVYSKDGYYEGVSVSYVIDQTSAYIMVGLNSDPSANASYDSIDYCWYTQQGGGLNIYENGASIASIDGHTSYAAGDEFKVEYSGGYVKYYHNGVLCRIVARYRNGAKLYMDSSFHNSGSISKVKVTPIISQSLPYFYRNTDISNYDTVNTPSYIATVGISGGNPVTATKPSGMDNAWGIIHMHTHAGNYATQLGFGGTTGNLYMRNAYNSTAFGGWRTILDNGNYTTYLNDTYVNVTGDSMTGTLRLGAPYHATASERFTYAALEIREAGRVANAQTAIGYAPRIGFHWGGIVAASLVFHSDGAFYFRNQADTGQAPVYASTFYGNLSGNAATATEARVLCTDATMKLYAQYSNEVNFGGTNNSGTIYFGYRAVDSKPIPTSFVFGGSTGTATVTASKFIGTLQGSATSSGYLTKAASYTTIAETDAFLENNKVQWATVGAGATSLNNDGIVMSYGWSATYGAQMFLDDGSGAANCYIRNRAGGSTWNAWRRLWASGDAVTSAVWNDYAECRESACEEPGYVLCEKGDDTLVKASQRLSHFAGVSSDTWGFSQGETEKAKTPIAVAGRVLVYPYQDRNNYKPGDCVCAAPGGTVDIMTREEVIRYPDRIVGTVSCVPDYEEWGGGESADREPVNVNGRIWIKVK